MTERIFNGENKKFIKEMLIVGTPVVVQNLLSSLVNMLDVFMVGQLGEVSITASAMGNQWFTLFILLCNGVTAAGGTFIAQHWGRKETENIHKYMGIMIVGAFFLAAFFSLLAIINPSFIISMYSKDPLVIEEGIQYIRINGFGYLFAAISSVYVSALRNTGRTKIPMVATIISLGTKMLLNYILIFGHFGASGMGIAGAAIATVLARIVEAGIIIFYTYEFSVEVAAGFSNYFRFSKDIVIRYLRYSTFIILGEAMYAVGTSIYNMIYKYAGTQSQAALQIAGTFQNLSMVFSVGVGTAAGVMLGRMLGEENFQKTKSYCHKFLCFTPILAAVIGGILLVVSPYILNSFKIASISREYVSKILILFALFMPIRTMNYTVIVGVLRSGGDSTICFVANFIGTWFLGIPMAYLGVVVFKLPIHYIYAMVMMDEVGKFIISFPRVMSMKWMRNIVI